MCFPMTRYTTDGWQPHRLNLENISSMPDLSLVGPILGGMCLDPLIVTLGY